MEEGNGMKHWPGKIHRISISSDYVEEGIPGAGVAKAHQGLARDGMGYEDHA